MDQIALESLRQRLRVAHRESGEMSTREISKRTNGVVSHTTVSQVLKCAVLPSWRSLEAVVAALEGKVAEFKALWIKAREEQDAEFSESQPPELPVRSYRPFYDAETVGAINLARILMLKGESAGSREVLLSRIVSKGRLVNIDLLAEFCRLHLAASFDVIEEHEDELEYFLQHGDEDEAESIPGNIWAAEQCLERGYYERALEFAHRARFLNPADPNGQVVHGRVLLAIGRYDDAEKLLMRVHNMQKRSPLRMAESPLGQVLKINGGLERLEELILAGCASEEKEGRLAIRMKELVEILMLRGKFAEAEEAQRQVVQKIDRNQASWAARDLARIVAFQGRLEEAIEILKSSERYETSKSLKLEHANLVARFDGLNAATEMLSDLLAPAELIENNGAG